MSKVITFSRTFQKSHKRAGEPTLFVEKILKSVYINYGSELDTYIHDLKEKVSLDINKVLDAKPKHHTVRGGERWKVGDKFSPRIWSGKPYASKQITIAPDIEIKQIWTIEIDENGVVSVGGFYISEKDERRLALNDGLSYDDFSEWLIMPCFRKAKPFRGQIICWSDDVKY